MRVLAAIFIVPLFAACAGSSEVTGNRRIVGTTNVTFTVKPARVEVGKSVQFTLRLANAGRDVTLTFPSGQRYDFWVTRGGAEVWRWSDDRSFTQQVTEEIVRSQESLTLDESWTPEQAGEFDVHGEVLAEGFRGRLTGDLVVGG